MQRLEGLKNALTAITENVYHYTAYKSEPPYLVWAEDGLNRLPSDGGTSETSITGTVDLYTLEPEDTAIFDAVQSALDGLCAWRLNSVQYEEDTGLTHYEWAWEVV